jgi:hypothetical protein
MNSPSKSPTSISVTVLPVEVVCGWDELIGIAWTVGWCMGKKESTDDGRNSLSLSAMSVIRGENVKLMHIELNARAIGVRLVSSSNERRRKNNSKAYGPDAGSSESVRIGESEMHKSSALRIFKSNATCFASLHPSQEFSTTNTFNLPVSPFTDILVVEAKDVNFKKQSATYASQMEVWVGALKVGVIDQGYRARCSKTSKCKTEEAKGAASAAKGASASKAPKNPSKNQPKKGLDQDCGLFWVLSITPPSPSADAVNVSNPLLRIVRHPCGCHWSSLPTGSLGIGFYTTTVHVSAPFIKACVEPVMWGRIFHCIAAACKAKRCERHTPYLQTRR